MTPRTETEKDFIPFDFIDEINENLDDDSWDFDDLAAGIPLDSSNDF